MKLLDDLRSKCQKAVKSEFGVEIEPPTLEFPEKFGDVSINCFHLARALKLAPPLIAQKLAGALAGEAPVAKAEGVSGYVNVTLDRQALFGTVLRQAIGDPTGFGSTPAGGKASRVMVEFASPNTNKPLHLGHVRNNCLGDSLSRLLAAAGKEVIRATLINDRGIHICKSMLAYRRLGNGSDPAAAGRKGDHFVGDFYVAFNTEIDKEMRAHMAAHPEDAGMDKEKFFKISEWGQEAQRLLRLWEAGDPATLALWETMNTWVIDGFDVTYRVLGIRFDRVYRESRTYLYGKDIVVKGLESGIFQRRADGAVEVDLSAEKLDKKVLLRSDGTSVYMTQDIGSTILKAEENAVDGQVFVVGDEQIHHFKVLFAILRRLGYVWAKDLVHLAYGMVNLPEGKMKSREGTVVDADDLIAEVTALAREEIGRRDGTVAGEDLEDRSRKIGLAALKFMILGVTPTTTMTYDPKASVNFEGDTGPYVLYAYARIRRMLEDPAAGSVDADFDATCLGDASEVKLALEVLKFQGVVWKAARDSNPSAVTAWLIDVAHAYHSHNRAVPILKAEDAAVRRARLALSAATAIAIRRGLELLGIETVNRM